MEVDGQTRLDIFSDVREGESEVATVDRYGVHQSTVSRLMKLKVASRSLEPRKRTGRPKCMPSSMQRHIGRLVETGKCDNPRSVHQCLVSSGVSTPSLSTIQRFFRDEEYKSVWKVRKPLISEANRQKRLKFAKSYIHWNYEQWSRVLWSDESKVAFILRPPRQHILRKKGSPLSKRMMQPTVKHGGGNIMVWGCMSISGPG